MIYCQFCLTQNEANADVCRKCGGKLLVLGRNQQWEEPETPNLSIEDHFLERISRLEETVSGILEHLSRMSESMEMMDRNSFISRSGLTALIETLRETNLLREDLLNQHWENTMVEQMEEAGIRDRFVQMRGRFMALYRGPNESRSTFASFIEEAEFLIYSDRSKESTVLLGRALELDQQNYELAYFLAEYYQQNGMLKEAMENLNTALDANPDHADSLLMLALLTYGEQNSAEARKLLLRCIEINPHNPVALLSMGSILTAEQRFEDAMPYLMRVNELDPQAQAYYLLGLGAKERGNIKEAIAALTRATEMDPDHEDAQFTLGLAFLERGWSRKARACFSKAEALNPGRLEYSALDDPPEDEPANDLDEDSMETLRFADQLVQSGKHKQALPHYRQLLKKQPHNPIFLSSYAVACFSLRRYEETLRATQKILDNNDVSEMVLLLAFSLQMEALRAMKRYHDAITLLTAMREEFPQGYGCTIANYGLAMTKADMGTDLGNAELLAREAVEGAPPEFRHNALDALGWVYFKQGRYEEALEMIESVVNMRESTAHLYHYGMILLALNLQEEAFKVFERTVKLRSKAVAVDDFIFAAINRELASNIVEGDKGLTGERSEAE